MKPALLGIILGTTLALAFAGSCSVSHPSDQYACTKSTDCTGGRVCAGGFCVVPGTVADARPDGHKGSAIDAAGNSCPGQCTSCNTNEKTCLIDCQQTDCTAGLVSCPSGYKCDIRCDEQGTCTHGVSCQNSASCQVECSGKNSCRGIQCGDGPCDVTCTGPSSCDAVACNQSCACDVVCTGTQSCTNNIFCSQFTCQAGSGCTSQPVYCHSCQ